MERGRGGGLGHSWVDDDDLGSVLVPNNALPEDRVGDARIRADEDQAVGFFEVLVSERRAVEAERLFVGDGGDGHALTGIAVAVDHPEAELGDRAQEGQLLGRELAGPEERKRVRRMLGLDRLDPGGHRAQCRVPIDRLAHSVAILQERDGGAVGGVQDGQGFPPLGAGHPEVDWIVGCRGQVDGLAVSEVDVEAASRRAVAANHRGRGVGGSDNRDLAQPESTRFAKQMAGQCSVTSPDQVLQATEQVGSDRDFVGRR